MNMDPTETSQSGRKVTCFAEMKTDLNLLLECLKFQMDNPDSQKETLAAVRSICQDNNDACDYFREIGGLMFLNNLAKSSSHSMLKETCLYTLAILAENSVYCQQALGTPALFEDIHAILSDEQSSVNLKRMCVFIFLIVVSNNKAGQSLSRESGCIDILLRLFSKLSTCNILTDGNRNPQYQLWSSVCSALCACVNNPQHEENQKLCSSAFPQAIERLQESLRHEMARPVCSLIGLTVANSRFAQDYFSSIGGLDILADVLSHLVNDLQGTSLDSRLAIVVTKTLDACIAENSKAIHHLAKHNVISSLMSLLTCGQLEAEDKFSIVLAVGHLTEDCGANQYELLKSNGLPFMIQVLAESQDDELHKAATFVLQNCRRITETLSLSLNERIPKVSHDNQREPCLDEYRGKAEEIFLKIQHLQHQYDEGKARQQVSLDMTKPQESSVRTSGGLRKTRGDSCIAQETCGNDSSGPASSRKNITFRDAVTQTLPNRATETLHNDLPPPDRGLSGTRPEVSSVRDVRVKSSEHSSSVRQEKDPDPMMVCADIIDKEMSSVLDTRPPLRCSGCLVTGHVMNSRNCSQILMGCPNLCERHRVLLQAEERYRTEYRKFLHGSGRTTAQKHRNMLLTPLRRGGENAQNKTRRNRILLTPIRKTTLKGSECAEAACPLQGSESECDSDSPPKRREISHNPPPALDLQPPDQNRPQKGPRKNFTKREIANLLDGVEKFGHHWNAILWSYPFQKGRRNVELAKKYKQLRGKH
ncbi:telomere repeats-binding bouquet formation protein 1 [Bufo bufo]|uniref:telomere repeats-binding bouquet formation protein 1 n=1 Tax=Bufo bufo TaxID=8384 RepID=UPI001ABE7A13|nr:telomere repeats-binding bouquet formation protein 1 [Bufo bufo]